MSELEKIKELAKDAVSALRYVEQTYGRLYGVGWDRVFESAKVLLCEDLETEPKSPEVHPDMELSDTYVVEKHCIKSTDGQSFHLSPGVTISGPSLKQTLITPKPVHKGERLPEANDCNSEGKCWLTTTEAEPGWVLDNPEQCTGWTHWLPFQSLPLVK